MTPDPKCSNQFLLSTGKQFYAGGCALGIQGNCYDGDLEITLGCDDGLWDGDYTRDELHEIADYAIAQWQAYKRQLDSQ